LVNAEDAFAVVLEIYADDVSGPVSEAAFFDGEDRRKCHDRGDGACC